MGYRLRNIQKKIRQEWLASRAKGALKHYIESTRRLGKSEGNLFTLSECAIQKPGSKWGFYAPVKEGLRDYIKPLIADVFSDCPDDLKPSLDSHLTLAFPNGSEIIFRGSNNQQHRIRRGNDLDGAVIDEGRDVDDLDDLIKSVVIPSLFTGGGWLIISSTPADTEEHPLHEVMIECQGAGTMSHYTIEDCHRYDPEEFPRWKIEKWRKETNDEVAWAREYMARWVKDPTKVIIPEWDAAYVQAVPHDEYFQFYHKYDALDSGVTDKTVDLLGYYDFRKAKLIIEGELVLQGEEVRTDRIADGMKLREIALGYQAIHDRKDQAYAQLLPHEKVYRRVADNNNLILVNDLNALHGLDFYPTQKDELAAMINLCREWVKDGRILVAPRCRELIGCLSNAIWDKNRKELARSKTYGHFDALMALVYLVRNIDTHTNPIPKFYGKSWATHAGVPLDANRSETGADRLARIVGVRPSGHDQARANFARTGGMNGGG